QFLRAVWGYSLVLASVLLLPLFIIEVLFLAANLLKIHYGGWVPVALALAIMIMIWTWTRGQAYLKRLRANNEIPLDRPDEGIERDLV
ncbi:KUP/HAK/KT family potassium transporter, partial [Rhizobium leguminosarum]|uniref:KUP/HAK/KT family potassium transporter n=1 Tax=Rhizobium leguminosarum TaxID=384 RepID=UPI003F9D81AB